MDSDEEVIHFLDIQAVTARHAEEIETAVNSIVHSGWYLRGQATEQFEQAYSTFIGTTHCVGCANGLDALTLIFKAYISLGTMHEGDEVIVPANTFIASILAITRCGLHPILVEPDRFTQQIDVTKISEAITSRTRALMLVHLYGRCAYTDEVGDICKQHGLKLIEDNAQAHGCRFHHDGSPLDGQRTGSLGDAAGHSFYPGKNLGALGDAGAVTTNDADLAIQMRRIGNYGMEPKYHCDVQGFNSRIDEIQAAVLQVKLRYLDEENVRRQVIAEQYFEGIHSPACSMSRRATEGGWVYHIFPIFTPYRDALQGHLAQRDIETNIHYPVPPHRQPCFQQFHSLSLPITEKLAATELSLPISPAMSNEEVQYVIKAINSFNTTSFTN